MHSFRSPDVADNQARQVPSQPLRRFGRPLPPRARPAPALAAVIAAARRQQLAQQMRPRLVMMVREPKAGRVKTRLARGVGTVAATAFYRTSTAGLVARLARDRRWELVLAVTPDIAVRRSAWPADVARVPQRRGDLGARMQALFDGLPRGPVIIIGSDTPTVSPHHIAGAFRALGRGDVVLGPAGDGGYWLIGAKRRPHVPRPFQGVRWSSEHTLADTRANLGAYTVVELTQLDDIDEAGDLARCRGAHARRIVTQ